MLAATNRNIYQKLTTFVLHQRMPELCFYLAACRARSIVTETVARAKFSLGQFTSHEGVGWIWNDYTWD